MSVYVRIQIYYLWVGTNTLLQLKKNNIRLYNRRSNIFDKEGKSDISLQLLSWSADPFLWTGMTVAIFNLFGNIPSDIEWLKTVGRQ